MSKPTLLRDRPENTQVVLAVVIPLLFGAVVGVVLGTSASLYWILLAVAAKVSLGSSPPLLIVIDAIAGALLAALGCWLNRRGSGAPDVKSM